MTRLGLGVDRARSVATGPRQRQYGRKGRLSGALSLDGEREKADHADSRETSRLFDTSYYSRNSDSVHGEPDYLS
jgi:hypothetical protein